MATFKSRGQIAMPSDIIQLEASFRDLNGDLADLDVFPEITISQPDGMVIMDLTSVGVYKKSTGVYGFDYTVVNTTPYGVWADVWRGTIGGNTFFDTLNFVIMPGQVPEANTDGYIALGDDPGFNYSQTALMSINKLIKSVKARLNSSGLALTKDAKGNDLLVSCDIFTVDQLAVFVAGSLAAFNQIPHFTSFNFEDTNIIDQFFEVLSQHASMTALASKVMIERGKEFNLSDNGISFVAPGVSDVLQTQYSTELTNWFEKCKLIKANCKPAPLGLGLQAPTTASPAFRAQRHRREGRIY